MILDLSIHIAIIYLLIMVSVLGMVGGAGAHPGIPQGTLEYNASVCACFLALRCRSVEVPDILR